MYKINKAITAVLAVIVLLFSATAPLYAAGPAVIENTDYVTEDTAVIGLPDLPLTVRADGSFTVERDGTSAEIVFGKRTANATVSFDSLPYPVSTHKYKDSGMEYTLQQFVYKTDEDAVHVYSRLEVKNNNDVSVAFPSAEGALLITEAPEELSPSESATADYVTVLSSTADGAKAYTYDDAKKQMTAFWKDILSDKLTVKGLPKDLNSAFKEYQKEIIYSYIGVPFDPRVAATASPSLARESLAEGNELYACAVSLMKTGDSLTANELLPTLREKANALSVPEVSLPYATLEENLSALLSLQSYGYILRSLNTDDDALTEEIESVSAKASALGNNIANALKKAENSLSCHWEAATTDATYGIVLNGESFASASALYEWYINSSIFNGTPSKELFGLACDAKDYHFEYGDPVACINSLVLEKENGTLVIGNGSPASLLSDKTSFTVKNFILSSGKPVTVSVSVDKKTVNITVTGDISIPIHVRFDAFVNNIEYASTGFDSEAGTVTAPEGTKSITVRMTDSASSVNKEKKASAKLESALASAYSMDHESCTSVSADEYLSKLKSAEKARTSTADKKTEAAEALTEACSQLSPMTAGYEHSVIYDSDPVGKLSYREVYQKFSLPSSGTVDTLFVKGEYHDGISAAVYTLRGDAYTTDELRAETYGTEIPGGIAFDLDFIAEGGQTYVLCIFSEAEDVTLNVGKSYEHTVHTQSMGQTVIYTGASLMLEFSVSQVNRAGLDTFYSACLEADVSGYTKESQKVLKTKLKAAKTVLCTPSVTEKEYNKAYDELKDAYDSLDTYASKEKVDEAPLVGLILIGVVILLLCITFVSAMIARKRMGTDK